MNRPCLLKKQGAAAMSVWQPQQPLYGLTFADLRKHLSHTDPHLFVFSVMRL